MHARAVPRLHGGPLHDICCACCMRSVACCFALLLQLLRKLHGGFRCMLQRCPLCMSSVASYPLCVLHVAGCSNAACCRLKQHVATLRAVGSARCTAGRCILSGVRVACCGLKQRCMLQAEATCCNIACCRFCTLHCCPLHPIRCAACCGLTQRCMLQDEATCCNIACCRFCTLHRCPLHPIRCACCMLRVDATSHVAG
jgi:hypothetical protein